MSFEIQKKPTYTLIKVKAEKLDTAISPSLKSELVILNSEGIKNIVIDLTETRYCDSSGLSSILVANRLCKNSKGAFVLMGIQDSVKKLISISQLDSILNIASSVTEAETMLSAALENQSRSED
ncbi:MAG: STAS domain-containing protein [Bacteroidetes bacterium]|nr:STAS domain-containing protein [Bacteroidota bacterium]